MKSLFYLVLGLLLVSRIQCGTEDIDFHVTLLDSPLLDIQWCGNSTQNDRNVLVLTNKGTVYRSGDRGNTWEKLSDDLQKSAITNLKDIHIQVGFVNKLVRSQSDSNLVFLLGSNGIHWVTEDCGDSVRSLGKGKNLRELTFHPTEKNWILGSSWTNCYEKGSKKQVKPNCQVSKELYLSQDMGRSWSMIANFIVQFSWGMRSANNSENIPQKRILLSQELNHGNTSQKINGWSTKAHLFYSDDFFKTKKMIVNQGNKFLLTSSYLFVAQVTSMENQHINLLVADPNTESYNFRYTEIGEELKQHSFTILDTSEGQVFINVNSIKPNSPMGNIYMSDSTGTRYSLSLKDNVKDAGEGQCDFEKVASIDGIYIANSYEGNRAQQYKDLIFQSLVQEDEGIQLEKKSSGPGSAALDINSYLTQLESLKKTRITFDKGGIWKPLSAPLRDSEGSKINCDQNSGCSLHLHSISSKMRFGPFYSTENSVGLVMGTGNVGKYLSNKEDQVNTYLSRDGGLTWFEVRKGSHIYEIADHGGLILMASNLKSTNILYYSYDEGLHWRQISLGNLQIDISNIVTEPSNIAQRFIVYGETTTESNSNKVSQGVIVSLDFEDLHQQRCAGADQPDTDDSDYETWSPNGKINPNCLLGKKVTYIRRKRESMCFNGELFEKVIKVDVCECTEEDWECDIGFRRQGDGPCLPQANYVPDNSPPEQCEGYYWVTQGYRKVAGDLCTGGVDHKALKVPCPMFSFLSSNNFYSFLIIIVILFVIYHSYQYRTFILAKILETFETLNTLAGKSIGKGDSNKQGYIDFSKMEFEKNDMEQFDSDLIEDPKVQQVDDVADQKQSSSKDKPADEEQSFI